MDKIVIKGGIPLKGSVSISGSKNASLPIMVAALLAPGKSILSNVPPLNDINTMGRLLAILGAKVDRKDDTVTIDPAGLSKYEAPYDLVRTMRASFLVLGPLLARFGKARVSLPGGCAIGARPIDIHLKALADMGAKIRVTKGYVEATTKRLRGTTLSLDYPSVGATENILMAASMAQGRTTVENAAREPEVVDLATFLKKMGAKISGEGTSVITIDGVKEFKRSVSHGVIPDRIEAGTFMIAACITRSKITLESVSPECLGNLEFKLKEAGARISYFNNQLTVQGPRVIRAENIQTSPYPGFPTDLQAQWMALMAVAQGTSTITESVFENRFMHASELTRMGAQIKVKGQNAVVKGVPVLSGAKVMASDLRASAALILAGLVARGTTEIFRVYHLDRGYHRIEEKLKKLGARIERVRER
jgi:UDP-N-acetylglucosamine 1-carboxyvinyltransferase